MSRTSIKIIFLDFDGVLNNPGCYVRGGSGSRTPAAPDAVKALNHILESTGALIVISSSWRALGLMTCKEKLWEWGVLRGRTLDTTPYKLDGQGDRIDAWRYEEIQLSLEELSDRRDIESFVILDDESDFGPLKDYHVHTDGSIGLTMEDAERAIAILNQSKI